MANESGAEEEFEVVVEGAGENTASQNNGSGPDIAPEEGIESLKARLKASDAARVEAENRARQASALVNQEARRADVSDLQVIEGAISGIRQNNDILKANKRALLAQGKWDAAVDIDEQMAMNAAKLLRLEEGKAALEPTVRNPPPQVQQQPQNQNDAIERYVSTLHPRSASWIRQHPEYVLDPAKTKNLEKAHYAALGEGIAPDTDDYYSFVEGKLFGGNDSGHTGSGVPVVQQQHTESPMSDASKPKSNRTAPPPAAPVSRSSGNKMRVTLTGEEIDAAKASGVSPEEYYKNKQALLSEGRIGKPN